ncbi:uncharacterized protein N7446_004512 [Penicillium canescens]|uniref:Subtelomeric hrmA-associated cluster protein AFUB-079030/YDR124W-like helical bundle domain-containing protein n=1 Tax=Penicillium canescens TaxID=5083 RepID=A0AAD6I1P8_PENCN|nr:uncharacterized protein N7446_004512 [Penicillium canescens]KAJ6026887.1 hypothetical protein N7460_011704 [Penicillium canescens]KAJ6067475.1 hypothetical protein N7446_004512 [Penicillium canescens]
MDTNRGYPFPGELERRHSDTCIPHQPMNMSITPKQPLNPEFPHPHFAMIYIDHNGEYQLQTSASMAGCGGAIFTPDVTDRFLEMTCPGTQASPSFSTDQTNQASFSAWDVQSSPNWVQSGQTRPMEKIPFEWQTPNSRNKKRRPNPAGIVKSRSKSLSPPPTATPPPTRTVLRVGNRALLRRYYEKAFEDFQQLNCRAIAKSYIKLVEPRKQVHFPYNGRRVIAGVSQRVDPEYTKPGWWPAGVLHKEPDHLLKNDRLRLLVHILCELKDSHGVTAEKLRDAGQDVRRQITPANKLQVLDEIYFVRQMEERFLDGEIDASTLIQITHTHLPEAIYHDVDEVSPRTQAASASASAIKQDHDINDAHNDSIPSLDEDESKLQPHSHILPLSPTTSESSGPHSPRSGGFSSYPLVAPPPTVHVIPPESPTVPKPMHDPSYMSGYYAQPFMSDKGQGFWPHASPVSQYGY